MSALGPHSNTRPGRLLAGWLDESSARALGPTIASVWNVVADDAVRAVVARSTAHVEVADVDVWPFGDDEYVETLVALDPSLRESALTPGYVDLRQLVVSQCIVALDDPRVRELRPDPTAEDLVALCLPLRDAVAPTTAFDERAKSWILRGHGSSISVVGRHAGGFETLEPGTQSFGFIVSAQPSRMVALELAGRLVLRDGHHRALALLARGITRVPMLIGTSRPSDFQEFGCLPLEVLTSSTAPTVSDYLDNEVSVDVQLPRTEKVVIFQAIEIDLPV